MPAIEMCGGETFAFEQMHENHAISTIRNGGVMYSVVGSRAGGKMSTSDIRPIFGMVEQTMCPGHCQPLENAATAPAKQ
jgi:hypothetical protein